MEAGAAAHGMSHPSPDLVNHRKVTRMTLPPITPPAPLGTAAPAASAGAEAFTHFLGVDVAKATLALHLLDAHGHTLRAEEVPNAPDALEAALRAALDACALPVAGAHRLLVCCEHTGQLSTFVVATCRRLGVPCWRADAALVQATSATRRRGKTDAADALMIARYCLRYRDHYAAEPTDERELAAHAAARRLGLVKSIRGAFVKMRTGLKTQLKEIDAFGFGAFLAADDAVGAGAAAVLAEALEHLGRQIAALDALLRQAAAAPAIADEMRIAQSCPGVGPVLSSQLAVATHGFTRLGRARQLAAHACVAPFERTSGTSLNRGPRTSKQGDRELKRLLTMGAQSCVRHWPPYREYYWRKRAEGKKHLVVINNIRNKILHTLTACLAKGVMYDKNYQMNT